MKPVPLDLSNIDGNAYVIIAKFSRAARRCGWAPQEIAAVAKEATSGDYDHLLQTIIRHVRQPDDEEEEAGA